MSDKQQYLRPFPEEQLPSSGPSTSAGCALWSVFILLTLFCGVGLIVTMTGVNKNDGSITVFAGLGVLWFIILVVIIRYSGKKIAPQGKDILRDILNFELGPNFNDVGITAICRPDEVAPDAKTALLIFMQNYASRPRTVTVRLPKSSFLGGLSGQFRHLQVGPGQCVVYREVFHVPPNTAQRAYVATSLIKVRFPDKLGVRLIPKSKKTPSLILFRPRMIDIPLAVNADINMPTEDDRPGVPPQYISLYVPTMDEPRFEVLKDISTTPPSKSLSLPQ